MTGDTDNAVVHALFFNYLSEKIISQFHQLRMLYIEPNQSVLIFGKNTSCYLPSRKLDEEYQYVLERKYHARHVGSTLAKPQLLLKRLFLNDTVTSTQTAAIGEMMQSRDMQSSRMMMNRAGNSGKVHLPQGVSSLNPSLDFIENAAKWLYGAEAEDGEVLLPIENNQYAHILILATNGEGLS